MKAFLDGDQAIETKTLSKNGVSNATAVINKLAKKFGEAVRRPVNKGDDYHIRVRTLKKGDSHGLATS